MAEGKKLSNGTPSKDGVETTVMITTETDIPAKTPDLHMHTLRNWAICSIICGCSCIGVLALIYAIKASEKQKVGSHDSAVYWHQKSRCMCLLSIGVGVSIIIIVPLLVWLISYIVSHAE